MQLSFSLRVPVPTGKGELNIVFCWINMLLDKRRIPAAMAKQGSVDQTSECVSLKYRSMPKR